MTKFKILAASALFCAFAFIGCQTQTHTVVTTDSNGNSITNTVTVKTFDTNRVDAVAKQAAIDGTTEILNAHPEWRPQFQQAEDDLNLLAASPSISINDILTIMQRLPVKELKSTAARLSFEGATLTIALLDVPQLPSNVNADLQSVAKAIADGVALGIASAPPVPVKAAPTPATSAVITSLSN